jgi:outer membrane biosynthesis protein TonB
VKDAFNGWTEYKQWPKYMHRANQVDPQIDEKQARVRVTEKMWGFKRPFTAEIVEQRPDEHIKWNSAEGTKHTGVINFHELGPRLTLIEVNLDHAPSGLVEKFARGNRFVKRAVRADLHRFQGWIEMKSEDELAELEGWRGTIEGGQITKSHEDTVEEEEQESQDDEEQGEGREEEQPEGSEEEIEGEEEAEGDYEEEPEGAEEEEPEASEEEEPEDESEPEDEYEEEPEGSEDEEPEGSEDEEPEDEESEEPEDTEPARPRRRQSRQRAQSGSGQQRGRSGQGQPRRRARSQDGENGSESSSPSRRRRPARQQSGS